ncbi:MAG: DUF4390 domain-containing protein [Gammaproteobacteria bacterium]|nr:DUF4390 domain-containing protein [Gammaproteobacteria bacterium]
MSIHQAWRLRPDQFHPRATLCTARHGHRAMSILVPGLLALVLLSCDKPSANSASGNTPSINLRELSIEQSASTKMRAAIDLRLGSEVTEALRSGIPITITVDLRLGLRYRYFAREINTRSFHWVLSYLPLSERYTLKHALSGDISSFPRLNMLLDSLHEQVAYPWQGASDALNDGQHQLQIRVRLNRLRLPAPLRLPAMISRQWRLQDGWRTLLIPADDVANVTAKLQIALLANALFASPAPEYDEI